MTNKEKYNRFCNNTYVPIYSKPFWMDSICGEGNWDVWLYEKGGAVLAAMPFYMEKRGGYRYITKAPLTQNNGILFNTQATNIVSIAKYEQEVIDAACHYIDSLGLDVYEQQYVTSFQNWTPFYWHNFTNILRYTYIIAPQPVEKVYQNMSSNYRKMIKRGELLCHISEDIGVDEFYNEQEATFQSQGKPCPFSKELWERVYQTCLLNKCGKMLCARDEDGNVAAVVYLIWDEQKVYHLLGGYSRKQPVSGAYNALTWNCIKEAMERELYYDFEGSMIAQIAKSFREYGGKPTPYYRIRKVYNPEIIRSEAEKYILTLQNE